jgi:hypothetical protein
MAYTTIDDPSAYFQTALYTGNGGSHTITNDGNSDLQPDLLWIKARNSAQNHQLHDSTRGANKGLNSNNSNAEYTDANAVTGFTSDGFTMNNSYGSHNSGSNTYVAWQWAANGGTTTTNDASATGVGNTDSVYQANTTAGFSIVTWTGPSGSDVRTMAHGLGGTPELIIYKNRDEVFNWYVGTSAITFNFNTDYLQLNTNIAKATDAGGTVFNSAPTSTVIGGANSSASAKENIKYVAYCFRSIQGYSKIGSYTGNGSTDGPMVYCGFKPAWVMIKLTSSTENWIMMDNKRDTFNNAYRTLLANASSTEDTSNDARFSLDFVSNGFKVRSNAHATSNGNGSTYIYMAFAESPFVGSDGVPTTAR